MIRVVFEMIETVWHVRVPLMSVTQNLRVSAEAAERQTARKAIVIPMRSMAFLPETVFRCTEITTPYFTNVCK